MTAVTSWLPVTTAWSAPPACSSLVWGGNLLDVNDPGYGQYVDAAVQCLPPAATPWWDQKNILTTLSLGPITCPQTYSTAMTSISGSSTFVACCPSDYSFVTVGPPGILGQCQSTLSKGQELSVISFTTFSTLNSIASEWITVASTMTSPSYIYGVQMNGWIFAAQTSTSSASSTIASTPASVSTPSSAASPSSVSFTKSSISTSTSTSTPSSSTHLNSFTAATSMTQTTITPSLDQAQASNDSRRYVGIGVGISLGAVTVSIGIFIAWWFWRRRSRAARKDTAYANLEDYQLTQPYSPKKPIPTQEVQGSVVGQELEQPPPILELSANEQSHIGSLRR